MKNLFSFMAFLALTFCVPAQSATGEVFLSPLSAENDEYAKTDRFDLDSLDSLVEEALYAKGKTRAEAQTKLVMYFLNGSKDLKTALTWAMVALKGQAEDYVKYDMEITSVVGDHKEQVRIHSLMDLVVFIASRMERKQIIKARTNADTLYKQIYQN